MEPAPAYLQTAGLHLSKEKLKTTKTQLQMYREFVRIIRYTMETWICLRCLDVPSFFDLHRAVKSELGNDPHYLVFSTIHNQPNEISSAAAQPTISITCDDDPEKACECYRLYRQAKQRDAKPTRALTSIAFADDRYYPQLQAADLSSWVTRAEGLHRYHRQDYTLRELFAEFSVRDSDTRLRIHSPFWDRDSLEDFGKRIAYSLEETADRYVEAMKMKRRCQGPVFRAFIRPIESASGRSWR